LLLSLCTLKNGKEEVALLYQLFPKKELAATKRAACSARPSAAEHYKRIETWPCGLAQPPRLLVTIIGKPRARRYRDLHTCTRPRLVLARFPSVESELLCAKFTTYPRRDLPALFSST